MRSAVAALAISAIVEYTPAADLVPGDVTGLVTGSNKALLRHLRQIVKIDVLVKGRDLVVDHDLSCHESRAGQNEYEEREDRGLDDSSKDCFH